MITTLKDRTPVITRAVPFKLSADEIATKGQELARRWKALEEREEQIKRQAKAAKEQLEAEKPALSLLRREVDSGTEERVVDCYREPDLGARCWRVYRCDTDEKVDDVSMTKDEIDEFRQMDLIDKLSDEKANEKEKRQAKNTIPPPVDDDADGEGDHDGHTDDDAEGDESTVV
jgi:hypothetical protein